METGHIALPLGTVLDHLCPECGCRMILQNSRFGLFYGCEDFPACRATHGAHRDGRPLGIPADKATKQLRIAAHEAFDKLWKCRTATVSRGAAYQWLQLKMGMSEAEAHIGRFNAGQCRELITILTKEKSHGNEQH